MQTLPLLVSLPDEAQSVKLMASALRLAKEDRSLALDLYSRRLPPLAVPACLAYLLGVSNRLIASMQKWPERYYRIYFVKKASGGERRIEAPRTFLKVIQTWINAQICSHLQTHDCAMGFVKGRSIFDNGRLHAPNRNLLVVDIKDFFPSVAIENVIQAFDSLGFGSDVSLQLARLCCLAGRLPQGAPTSPGLSNAIFRPVDIKTKRLVEDWGCVYTRYADDLAISGAKKFTPKDLSAVRAILEDFGFSINIANTRFVGPGGRQIVAGLVVNKRPMPPRSQRRLWRAIFDRALKHPQEFVDRISYLAGVASFVKQYSPDLATRYSAIARRVQERAKTGPN